ncbi:MAG: hypothetical protein WC525_05965 [Candidatus Thermoplasmatota archaeon]
MLRTRMNTPSWRKTLVFLAILEAWWFIVGTCIHEWTHTIQFYILSGGQLGDLHVFDAVSIKAGTLGICYPPSGLVIQDTIFMELIAYFVQGTLTVLFGFLLWKKYYLSEEKGEMIC